MGAWRGRGAARRELGLAILRVAVGVVFLSHGAPKLVGGVGGLAGMLDGFGFPAPYAWAWFVAGLEFFGGILLLVGLLVTPVSLLLAVEMAVGMVLVHAPNGWYVVGPGTGGVEFNVALIAALAALALAGPGAAAVDRIGRGERTGALSPDAAEPPAAPPGP